MTKNTQLFYLCLFFMAGSLLNTSKVFAVNNEIQRVRVDFTMPNGYVRHLLLGFTPDNAASDGVDYGYDALNIDNYPSDLNWLIEDKRYIIQGVGAFDTIKKYPLGLFLKNSGDIEIRLNSLENFESTIDVYIFDSLLNTYTQINNYSYSSYMENGDYLDRFYLAFKKAENSNYIAKSSLSTEDEILQKTKIQYLTNTKELYINTNNTSKIKKITLTNSLGQNLFTSINLDTSSIKTYMYGISSKHVIINIVTDIGQISKQLILTQ